MLRILLLLLALTAQAQAGPWPREQGKLFLAFGNLVEISAVTGLSTNTTTIYVEYGLADRTTLGVDLGGVNGRSEKAIAFLRYPVFEKEGRKMLYAAELGLGQVENKAALRPGFSLGRGLTLFERGGWFTLDSRAVIFVGSDDPLIETDLTLGLAASKNIKLIAQLQAGKQMGEPAFLKFVPSIVHERKPGQHSELGAVIGIKGDTLYGFKFNIWRDF